ncbi:septum formation family protein [Plantactinospora sp. CA-290183]|uniref:septum formation family protein n=1 Tax=Plantactinospora sp. CA-290183 TaxID=3240006 RepID=UPI003D8C9F89
MRRWMTALALAGVVGLGVVACAAPGGSDGDLTDDWARVGEPQVFIPSAGTCHAADFAETAYLSSYRPVDCATNHRLETVHVGTFTGAAAERAEPPAPGSTEARAAYGECDTGARSYLGDDWRVGRLWLGMAKPSPQAWAGGARWFRCDVTELTNVEDNGDTASRTASLKGALGTRGPLHLGCYAAEMGRNRTIEAMPPIDCGRRHNSEFAGVWAAPASAGYPTEERDWAAFYDGCYQVAARYAGVPQSSVRFRTGVVALPGGPGDWRSGNRGVRCYLWISDGAFTRSLKGAGSSGLPVRTG